MATGSFLRNVNRGAAVGTTQTVAVAVVPDRLIDDLLPALEVSGLLFLVLTALIRLRPAGFPPGEPAGTEGMHEEVEQAGEAHANDGIPFTALAIALDFKAVVEQTGHRESTGAEGIRLRLLVLGIDLV